jgi:hypothetical protein
MMKRETSFLKFTCIANHQIKDLFQNHVYQIDFLGNLYD